MGNTALFIFKGTLQDFLPSAEKVRAFEFKGNPSVKDAIEAQGVPHVEVKEININKTPGEFNDKLQQGDEVVVSPYMPYHWSATNEIPIKFIVDGHLGKLAKDLRTLGFDSTYSKDFTELQIPDLAEKKKAIVLTRNINLLKKNQVQKGYWLRSQDPDEQVLEIIEYFDLRDQMKPFTRCRTCNGLIETVEKEKIMDQLPPMTKAYFHEFFQCQDCLKIYWKGSHFEKMEMFVQDLKNPK